LTTYARPRTSAAYQESAVLTASPERLVVMLYDGARRFLYQSAAAMRAQQVGEASERLRRAELIVEELLTTLDLERGGRIAQDLQGLYVFFLGELRDARADADADKLDWVNGQLAELREAWAGIGTNATAAAAV